MLCSVRLASVPSARTKLKVAAAWAIHSLTGSGAVLAFLAFLAVEHGSFRLALLWLAAAQVVDGIDGPLARWVGVKQLSPKLDGSMLDVVVDYVTYVFLPAIMIYRAGLLPQDYALVGVAAMLVSSLYTFARTDMKTADNFFRGFPALWNVVAFYLFLLQPGPIAVAIVVGALALLTFAPIHFVHPLRVRSFQPWLGVLTVAWGLSSMALLWPGWSPLWARALLVTSLAGAAGLVAIGLCRTLRGDGSRSER
jgi:phosphatidylcholine synthase